MQELERVSSAAKRTVDEISSLRRDLRSELNPERQEEIRSEINMLQMRNFRLQQELAETETELADADLALDESLSDSEASIENLANFKGALSSMSYDFENPEVVDYFDENPDNVKLISNVEELLKYLDQTSRVIPLSQIHRKHR